MWEKVLERSFLDLSLDSYTYIYLREGERDLYLATKVQRKREKETKIENINYSNTSIYQQKKTTKFLSSLKFYPSFCFLILLIIYSIFVATAT